MPAPRPKTVSLKPQVLAHLQLGEADVDAVEVGDQVAQHEKGHEAPEHLGVSALFERGIGCGGRRHGAGLEG